MEVFHSFERSGQNLSDSLCQFQSDKLIPLQILYLSSVSWKIIPLFFFISKNVFFARKEPIKMKSFEIFMCSVKFCQILYANFETTSWFPSKFCIPLPFHERICLCTFLGLTIDTLLNRSPLNWKFLRLSSARVKFCQIPYADFEMTISFLSKFCISLHFHERLFLCSFLAQTIYTLLKRSPLKWNFLRLSSAWVKLCQIPYANFETTSRFLSKFGIFFQFHEKSFLCTFLAERLYTLLNRSPLKWKFLRLSSAWVKFCLISYSNSKMTSRLLSKFCISLQFHEKFFLYYFFSSKNVFFAQKKPIKMKSFETFKCPGQILSNSICQFVNDKLIPLQILYLSSFSWKIMPLYYFSSNNRYFAQ